MAPVTDAKRRKRRRAICAAVLLRRALVASVLLLTGGVAHAQSAGSASGYVARVSTETALYADTDHVFVSTPTFAATISKPTAGVSVSGSYLVDMVSAASVDIVSTASRSWSEVRQAGTLDATYKPGTFGVTARSALSSEPDYLSYAAGLELTQDLLEKNVTLLAGYGYAHDTAGRTGTPFSLYSHSFDTSAIKAGVTFLLDRATVASALVDAQLLSGDSAETYRYVPLFAPGTAVPLGASIDTVNALRTSARAAERVPLSRDRYALTLGLAHRFRRSTLRLEERLYDDTWGLAAQTTDGWWLVDLGSRIELGPHLRLHDQTAVSFWQRAYTITSGLDVPAYRTGDRELGPLLNFTGGGRLRVGLGRAPTPMKWVLGFDLEATYTRYLDDLYLTDRSATLGSISIEGEI